MTNRYDYIVNNFIDLPKEVKNNSLSYVINEDKEYIFKDNSWKEVIIKQDISVGVFGCCASNVTRIFFQQRYPEVKTSFVMFSTPINYPQTPLLDFDFSKYHFTDDFTRFAWIGQFTKEYIDIYKNKKCDYLFLDLMRMNFFMFKLTKGNEVKYVPRVYDVEVHPDYPEAEKLLKDLENSGWKIEQITINDIPFDFLKDNIKKTIDFLKTTIDEKHIIIFWPSIAKHKYDIPTKSIVDYDDALAKSTEEIMTKCYEYITKELLPNSPLIKSDLNITSTDAPYGSHAIHYSLEHYDYEMDCLYKLLYKGQTDFTEERKKYTKLIKDRYNL